MKVALLNHIGAEHDHALGLIADVAQKYADLVCGAHGRAPVEVIYPSGAVDAPVGYRPLGAFKNPDVAGALGYHDVDSLGRAYGKAFLSVIPGGELLHDIDGKGQSLAGVLMHELAEMIGDEFANRWCSLEITDPESGKVYSMGAEELADWTQDFSFTLEAKDGTKIDCSDFVYPAFFNPNAQADEQLSYMRTVTKPGEVAPGCYGIVANEIGDNQVFGDVLGNTIMRTRHAFEHTNRLVKRIFHKDVKPPAWRESFTGNIAGRTTQRLRAND